MSRELREAALEFQRLRSMSVDQWRKEFDGIVAVYVHACIDAEKRLISLALSEESKLPLSIEQIPDVLPSGIYDCLQDPWDQGKGDGNVLHSIYSDVVRIVRAVEQYHGIIDENSNKGT